MTIRPVDILILVFGDGAKTRNTFNENFGVDINLAIWKLIGVIPFTRKCLEYNKVKHEIVVLPDGTVDIELDPLTTKLIIIEQENIETTNFLIADGYDSDQLECPAPKIPSTRLSVTVPGSRERQDELLKAIYYCMYFLYTKLFIINCNDSLISQQRATYMDVKDCLLACKKIWEDYLKIEAYALTVVEELKKDRNVDAYRRRIARRSLYPI